MTASKHPTKYSPELGEWTLAAANEFKVFRFTADSQNERKRGMFQFTNFWRALELALTKNKALYPDHVLERFKVLHDASQKLVVREEPGTWNYSMGPKHILSPLSIRLASVDEGAVPPLSETQDAAAAALLASLKATIARREAAPQVSEILHERAARDPLPPAPPPAVVQLSPEERERSRAVAQAGIHKSRQAGMKPHEAAKYQLEHGVDHNGWPRVEPPMDAGQSPASVA